MTTAISLQADNMRSPIFRIFKNQPPWEAGYTFGTVPISAVHLQRSKANIGCGMVANSTCKCGARGECCPLGVEYSEEIRLSCLPGFARKRDGFLGRRNKPPLCRHVGGPAVIGGQPILDFLDGPEHRCPPTDFGLNRTGFSGGEVRLVRSAAEDRQVDLGAELPGGRVGPATDPGRRDRP